jgi:hypothetical protein
MTKSFAGSCLCGQVAFSLIGEPTTFYTCHCKRCQKVTGSSNAANIFVSSAALEWLKGADFVTDFALHSEGYFNAAFCRNCGSPVPRQARSGDFIIVPAGCLDDGPTLSPERAIFWSDRASWFDAACEAERFIGYDKKVSTVNETAKRDPPS